MQFEKLEIKPEGSWAKRNLWSKHSKKTFLYMAIGATAGAILFLLDKDGQFANIRFSEMLPNILIGGFFGFFITNSPCARNKC